MNRFCLNFLRGVIFVTIVGSAWGAYHFAKSVAGSDTYNPADRIVRFVADGLCAIGFVPVLGVSVLLATLVVVLIGQSRERDA